MLTTVSLILRFLNTGFNNFLNAVCIPGLCLYVAVPLTISLSYLHHDNSVFGQNRSLSSIASRSNGKFPPTGNYRPCIDIEWVLSSLICFTNTCTSVDTVNKIAASSYTFFPKHLASPFFFEMLLQSIISLELLGKHQQLTKYLQNNAVQKQVMKGQFIIITTARTM